MSKLQDDVRRIVYELTGDAPHFGLDSYDMKRDWMKGLEGDRRRPTAGVWKDLCRYKLEKDPPGEGRDCDASLRSTVVFALAYGLAGDGWRICRQQSWDPKGKRWVTEQHKYCLKKDGCDWQLRGDTMNSYATTVHRWAGECSDSVILEQMEGRFAPMLTAGAMEFMCGYHTVGNLIPAPFRGGGKGEFNRPRGTGQAHDYWDLTLLCIYHHFHPEEDGRDLVWLLENETNAELCREWLDTFGSWDRFVERNLLDAFVRGSGKEGYGPPRELWTGHFTGPVLPETEEQYSEFFKNTSERIRHRGLDVSRAVDEGVIDTVVRQMAG